MKRTPLLSILASILAVLALAACQPQTPPPVDVAATYETYGAEIAPEGAVPVQAVLADADAYVGTDVKVEGVVQQVCQMKGCWLTLTAGAGDPVRINVPRTDEGYAYTFPTDISGRRVVVQGPLEATTLTAEEQQHLAEDAGETLDAAEDRRELTLTAAGALVEKTRT